MIRKYHTHTLQTNTWHREEEPENTNIHKTSEKQLKVINQIFHPQQGDCKTRKDTNHCISDTKHRTTTMGATIRIEMQISPLDWMVQNIRLFNVCEAQRASQGHLVVLNVLHHPVQAENLYFNPYVYIIYYQHTGQCKRTGGCYNELVVAFFSTGGGVKG